MTVHLYEGILQGFLKGFSVPQHQLGFSVMIEVCETFLFTSKRTVVSKGANPSESSYHSRSVHMVLLFAPLYCELILIQLCPPRNLNCAIWV